MIVFIKGILFAALLIASAIQDIRSREISNLIPAMMIAAGMIGVTPLSFLSSCLGLLVTALPYFLASMAAKRNHFPIGGGDIKLMAGCGFILGAGGGILQSLIALLTAVVYGVIIALIRRIKFNKVSIPLAPFICVSGIFVYLWRTI